MKFVPIGDDTNDLKTILISSDTAGTCTSSFKLFEPVVLTCNNSKFTILEFGGFLNDSSGGGGCDEAMCFGNSKIISSMGVTEAQPQVHVEKLLNNQKFIDYLSLEKHKSEFTSQPPPHTTISVKFIDSDNMYKFLDRIKVFESKSIFKKKNNFFSELIKSKLVGKFIMNGQTSFIECMGIQFPIIINIEGEIEKRLYYRVTKDDFNITILKEGLREDLNFEGNITTPTTEAAVAATDKLYRRDETMKFIEELSQNTLGGVNEQLEGICNILDTLYFKSSETHSHFPKTILIWGLQGTGKSTILRSIGKEYERRGIITRFGSGTSFNMDLFENMKSDSGRGTLICLDDIENLGTNIGHLFSALQNIVFNRGKCAVLAVSNKNIEDMDESVRQSGHFERDFYIPIPSSLNNKRDVLNVNFNRYFPSLTTEKRRDFLSNLQRFISGYVGRDVERIFKMAQYHLFSLRCGSSNIGTSGSGSTSGSSSWAPEQVCWEDFDYALRVVKPSQLHTENLFTILKASDREKDVAFSEIGGYSNIKQRCKELLYWPLEHPDSFHRFGLPTCCGILLHGPSGVGKTLLVKNLASIGKMNYISIKCPEVFSQYVGETEKLIRYIFKRAKQLSPCVLVFDEIDALAPRRELQNNATVTDSGSSARALSQLLNEMDGISNRKQVFIVGCTNRIELIDQAILRPGRLDQILYMHTPEEEDLLEIFQVYQTKMPFSSSVDIEQLVSMIKDKNWTGASVGGWCREAALESLREDIENKEIEMKHFINSLKKQE